MTSIPEVSTKADEIRAMAADIMALEAEAKGLREQMEALRAKRNAVLQSIYDKRDARGQLVHAFVQELEGVDLHSTASETCHR